MLKFEVFRFHCTILSDKIIYLTYTLGQLMYDINSHYFIIRKYFEDDEHVCIQFLE